MASFAKFAVFLWVVVPILVFVGVVIGMALIFRKLIQTHETATLPERLPARLVLDR